MSTKPLRVATICHNDDDPANPKHRRVRLELVREDEGYTWRTATGEDCCLGVHNTVTEAEHAALRAWGARLWSFRANWV